MKVSNMTSRNGNDVPNQFLIEDGVIQYFQSYSSIIAKRVNGELFLDERYWDYSSTTSKYRNMFTGMDTKETKAAIASGEITLVDLNNRN